MIDVECSLEARGLQHGLGSVVAQSERRRVGAGKAVEQVIERAVLLDDDDHVIDLADRRRLRDRRGLRRRTGRAAAAIGAERGQETEGYDWP